MARNAVREGIRSNASTARVAALASVLALALCLCADTTAPTVSVSPVDDQVMGTVGLSASASDAGAVRFGTCEWCVSASSSTCTSSWTAENVTESAPSMAEDQSQSQYLSFESSLSSIHTRLTQSAVPGADQAQVVGTGCENDFDKNPTISKDVEQTNHPYGGDVSGSYYIGEDFVPSATGGLMRAELRLKRSGSTTAPLEVLLYTAGSDHRPSGPVLATATIPSSSVPSGSSAWVNATFPCPYRVASGGRYALVARVQGGVGGTYTWYGCGAGVPVPDCYAAGAELYSTNGGSTWYVYPNDDRAFRLWLEADSGATAALSQSFTAGASYTMDRVSLLLSRSGSASLLNVSVWRDTDGDDDPDQHLGSASVSMSQVGTGPTWAAATGLSVQMTSGYRYCLVLKPADADRHVWRWWGSGTDAYGSGKFLFRVGEGAWSDRDASADRAFAVTTGKAVYNAERLKLRLRRFFPVLDQSMASQTSYDNVYGSANQFGQTFTVGASGYLPRLDLYLSQYGSVSSHVLDVSVYATTNGLPTGAPLASRSYLGAELPWSLSWFAVVFQDPPYLSAGTKYAVVLKCPLCPDYYNCMRWGLYYCSDGYSAGQYVKNTGSGWSALDTAQCKYDAMFRSHANLATGRWADEQNVVPTGESDWVYGSYHVGMGLRPQHDVKATQVDLYLSKAGSPADLVVEIHPVTRYDAACKNPQACGAMTSTVLASATVPASSVGTGYGWITVSFTSPPSLSANAIYAIVLHQSGNGGNSSNRYQWARSSATANIYTRANYFYSSNGGSTWTTSSTYSYGFKLFTDNVQTPVSLAVSLLPDSDRNGAPDAPSGGTAVARSDQSGTAALVRDRTYRGQVFKADASGIAAGTPLYLDRVELLLRTYQATSSAVLVSLQRVAGDTDVTAYDCYNQGSEDYVHSSHYAANTFQPSTWGYLSKVGINVKKVGSPEDLIVELRGADPSTGAPTSTLASGTLPAASVSSSSFQTFNVTLDPPAEYLDDGAWYTVVLRQKDDGGNGTNEYLVSTSSGTSCGADAKGWELVGGSWASSYVHYLKVYVAGPTDFTPREDIVAESRIPTSALPACSSGCERWVPVRFNTPITLANMSYYAVVAREEGGSSDVYWMLHGTSGNSTSYAVGRESGAWLMGRTYNPSERDMDYQTHALRVYANGPAIPSGTIQLSSIPLGSADWVETTLPGYGIAAAEPKVISLDARSGGVDADRYVIWAGAPSGTDAYGPGYAGSGSAYGTYGSATAAGDRGFGTWDSESTERSCSATWDTNWLTDGTATQDGVEYHVRFRAQDEAGNTGSGGAAFAPPEIVANEGVSEE